MSVRERAAKLLGAGVGQEIVATALGVSPSYVSQLLSEEEFAKEVTDLRFQNLQDATERDTKYDRLEDRLLDKAEELLPYMTKTREVMGALTVVNSAKRRGQKVEGHVDVKQEVVVLSLPTVIQQHFVVNPQNQVVQVGEQDLTTITAKALLDKTRKIPQQQQLTNQERLEPNGTSNRERVAESVGS